MRKKYKWKVMNFPPLAKVLWKEPSTKDKKKLLYKANLGLARLKAFN